MVQVEFCLTIDPVLWCLYQSEFVFCCHIVSGCYSIAFSVCFVICLICRDDLIHIFFIWNVSSSWMIGLEEKPRNEGQNIRVSQLILHLLRTVCSFIWHPESSCNQTSLPSIYPSNWTAMTCQTRQFHRKLRLAYLVLAHIIFHIAEFFRLILEYFLRCNQHKSQSKFIFFLSFPNYISELFPCLWSL